MEFEVLCNVFIANNNKFLFLLSSKGFQLPGGKLDYGEFIENCALREVFEETQIKLKSIKLIGVDVIELKNNGRKFIVISFFSKNKLIPKLSNEHFEFKFATLKEAQNMGLLTTLLPIVVRYSTILNSLVK